MRPSPDTSIAERIAWYALLAVPVAVPVAVGTLPFAAISPFTYDVYVYPKLLALSVLVGLSLAAWAVGLLTESIKTRSVPLKWWIVSFLGLATLSTGLGLSPMTAFFGGNYMAVGLLVFLLGGALYVLITQMMTSTRRMRSLAWATVAGGSIVAAIGVLQVLGVDALAASDAGFVIGRGGSLMGNPDFAGTYLVIPATLAAALALFEDRGRERVVAGAAFVLTTTALVMTLTRGAWVAEALGVAILITAYIRSQPRAVSPAKVMLTGLGTLALPLLLILRDPTRAAVQVADLTAGGQAGSGRLILWREALSIIARHPALGTGPDSYRLGWYAVQSADTIRRLGTDLTDDPHNVVLLLAATMGIPAALAIIGCIVAALRSSAPAAFAAGRSGARQVYTGWWAALAALCVALLFSPNAITVVTLVFAAAGVLMAPRSRPADVTRWVRYVAAGGAVGLAIAALAVSTTSIASDAILLRAQSSPDKIDLARQAARIAPWSITAQRQAIWGYAQSVGDAIEAGTPGATSTEPAAESGLRAMIAANPYEAWNFIQLAYLLNRSAPAVGSDALRRASDAADGALRLNPANPVAAYLKGLALLNLGDPAAALPVVGPMWNVDPTYANAGIVYAESLRQTGDLAKARAIIGELEKRFPSDLQVQDEARKIRSTQAN